jgi:hypothetical protein
MGVGGAMDSFFGLDVFVSALVVYGPMSRASVHPVTF